MTQTTPAMTDTVRGSLYMMAAMAGFVVNDGFMRVALADVPLFQAIFIRGLMLTVMLLILQSVRVGKPNPMSPRDRKIITLRTATEMIATIGFMTALMLMPFANLTAIIQVLPLSVTLAAAVFLKAPIGWRRMMAILIGFGGVMMIIRPDVNGFNTGSLIALGIVFVITIRDLAARQLSPQVSSIRVALITSVAITSMGAAGTIWAGWSAMAPHHVALLFGAAACLVVGYIAAVTSMRQGDIASVTPFRYTALIWAIIIGFLIFDERPDLYTLIGITIIVCTGIFTFYRERRLG